MSSPVPFDKDGTPSVPAPAVVPFGEVPPVLVQIGDIECTAEMVFTPSGEAPIADCYWTTQDMTQTQTKTPTWAIVMCVLLAGACGLGFLFLAIKETVTVGNIQVTVQGPGLLHTNNAPGRWALANDLTGRVNYARGLTQQARARRSLG